MNFELYFVSEHSRNLEQTVDNFTSLFSFSCWNCDNSFGIILNLYFSHVFIENLKRLKKVVSLLCGFCVGLLVPFWSTGIRMLPQTFFLWRHFQKFSIFLEIDIWPFALAMFVLSVCWKDPPVDGKQCSCTFWSFYDIMKVA